MRRADRMVGSPATATTSGQPSGTCSCIVAATSASSSRRASCNSSTVRMTPVLRELRISIVSRMAASSASTGSAALLIGAGERGFPADARQRAAATFA